jgi:hypothetical protein
LIRFELIKGPVIAVAVNAGSPRKFLPEWFLGVLQQMVDDRPVTAAKVLGKPFVNT